MLGRLRGVPASPMEVARAMLAVSRVDEMPVTIMLGQY